MIHETAAAGLQCDAQNFLTTKAALPKFPQCTQKMNLPLTQSQTTQNKKKKSPKERGGRGREKKNQNSFKSDKLSKCIKPLCMWGSHAKGTWEINMKNPDWIVSSLDFNVHAELKWVRGCAVNANSCHSLFFPAMYVCISKWSKFLKTAPVYFLFKYFLSMCREAISPNAVLIWF